MDIYLFTIQLLPKVSGFKKGLKTTNIEIGFKIKDSQHAHRLTDKIQKAPLDVRELREKLQEEGISLDYYRIGIVTSAKSEVA